MQLTYILCSLIAGAWCSSSVPVENIALVQRQAAVTSASDPDPKLELADEKEQGLAAESGQDAEAESRYWRRRRRSRRRRRDRRRRTRRRRGCIGSPPTFVNGCTAHPLSWYQPTCESQGATYVSWEYCSTIFSGRYKCQLPCTTASPTGYPTKSPTKTPTRTPTRTPTASPTAEPTDYPTQEPTEPVHGEWTITRQHQDWGTTKVDTVCGKETDTFSIGLLSSQFCEKKGGQKAQVVVNQELEERTWGWFCSDQGTTVIVGTPTFVAEAPEGPCAAQHNAVDDGT